MISERKNSRGGMLTPLQLGWSGDASASAGTFVADLLAGMGIGDVTRVAQSGIVVTAASGRGRWQYSLDALKWNDFGNVSPDSTVLLDAVSWVRYLAEPHLVGPAACLEFRAWEQTRLRGMAPTGRHVRLSLER